MLNEKVHYNRSSLRYHLTELLFVRDSSHHMNTQQHTDFSASVFIVWEGGTDKSQLR